MKNTDKIVVYKTKELLIVEENAVYTFDIDNSIWTNDVLEAVVYFMKSEHYTENSKLWNLPIKENMIDYIKPINSLYWLSGGINFWEKQNIKWIDNYEYYEKKFQSKIYYLLESCKTLGALRKEIMKNFNLDTFYEFAISVNLRKEVI